MELITAEKLMATYERIGAALNDATDVVATIPDHEEQKRLRRPLGELMQSLWTELMQPIVREHPELDPDKKRPS